MDLNDIGNTRLVQLVDLELNKNKLFAKCECDNPTSSHKDRTFHHIITVLEQQGKIRPGMTLVDCSTGNGGAALSWIGGAKGYQVVIFMPEGMTEERLKQITGFGGTIIETPKAQFLAGSVAAALHYVANTENAYYLNQAETPLNHAAWRVCGQEIITQLAALRLKPDYFVCAIGTGGTFSGIAKTLKAIYPAMQTLAIEVDKSAPIYAKNQGMAFYHQPHNLMGLGSGQISANTDLALIDEIKIIDGNLAWQRMQRFNQSAQLNIGPTCGANVFMSECLMKNIHNKVILTLFFDCAWKYHSRRDGNYPGYTH
ncbi:cysteine synthase family protein [Martelella alba]|uniref:PLP-dependent cysteine synthase family protein n=1 Tax=Martelella alba TaxID=2590451 RepID=A0ABY2SLA7_9HYPH|nr:PLP-dependent cysteine synthase family protein [Martelella alba]TKI06498.1 PLP-dependent cysteine synthase family protein [Martelella alba]